MAEEPELWLPGSFTKNFSWGPRENGLKQLHESIRVGFDGQFEDVPRDLFRARVASLGRPDFIPINFFLFNEVRDGKSWLVADELVFQALNFLPGKRFDKLALFAFLFSYSGSWVGARRGQRRPALWAQSYVLDKVAGNGWNTSEVGADQIQWYIDHDPRYQAEGSRKVATNLNWLFQNGRLAEFRTSKVERWWVDALFLALDRLTDDARTSGSKVAEGNLQRHLAQSRFFSISGARSSEKDMAARHLVSLYTICGGRQRFDDAQVRALTELKLPDVAWLAANDSRPVGAIHPSNPAILKSIPRACAMLARYLGFDEIPYDELENFDVERFVREHTARALARLRETGVRPTMTADQLQKITRGE